MLRASVPKVLHLMAHRLISGKHSAEHIPFVSWTELPYFLRAGSTKPDLKLWKDSERLKIMSFFIGFIVKVRFSLEIFHGDISSKGEFLRKQVTTSGSNFFPGKKDKRKKKKSNTPIQWNIWYLYSVYKINYLSRVHWYCVLQMNKMIFASRLVSL